MKNPELKESPMALWTDRNLLSAAEGGAEASGPETAPRAGLQPLVLHETIHSPPCWGRREPERTLLDGYVRNFLESRPILARSRLASRLGIRQCRAEARRSGGSGRWPASHRRRGGLAGRTRVPAPQAAKDALDRQGLFDRREEAHLPSAVGDVCRIL